MLRLGRFPWACERAVVESFKLSATLSESKRESTTDKRISVVCALESALEMPGEFKKRTHSRELYSLVFTNYFQSPTVPGPSRQGPRTEHTFRLNPTHPTL